MTCNWGPAAPTIITTPSIAEVTLAEELRFSASMALEIRSHPMAAMSMPTPAIRMTNVIMLWVMFIEFPFLPSHLE